MPKTYKGNRVLASTRVQDDTSTTLPQGFEWDGSSPLKVGSGVILEQTPEGKLKIILPEEDVIPTLYNHQKSAVIVQGVSLNLSVKEHVLEGDLATVSVVVFVFSIGKMSTAAVPENKHNPLIVTVTNLYLK